MNKLKQCQHILLGILIYFFVMMGITLILLSDKSYTVIGPEGFIAWVIIFIFGGIGLVMASIFKSRKARVFLSLFGLVISGGILIFLFGFQIYSPLELIFIGILGGLIILSGVLFFILEGKSQFITIICYVIGIGGFLIFFSVYFNKPFFLMTLQFIVLFPLNIISFKYALQTYGESHPIKIKGRILKAILIIIPIIATIILVAPVKTIEIDPKNSPEIIFWSDSGSLPVDEATLQDCYDHDIGFCVVLRDYGRYISDSARRHIEYLLNHSIITYICLGGPDGSFYCTTDSADEFVDIFKNIRTWLKQKVLYDYPSFRGFVVDAETPRDLIEDFGDLSFAEKCQYLLEKIPSRRELNRAEEKLDELIDLIHDDKKDIGIVKLPASALYDELDFDSDYAVLTRNIYSLDLPWDFSIAMMYRTQHVPTIFDYMIQDMDEYQYSKDYELEYLEEGQLERNLVPISTFYYELVFELHSTELDIDPEDRFIFIGNFDKKFRDTTYIENDEYQKDLDLCRHFGVKQVWFYDWSDWDHFYSVDDLIDHNEDLHDEWTLTIPVYMLNREIFIAFCTAVVDRFLYVY
ncbi:MAG: hypothetical protein ACFFCI_20875 [Promethearchaeota archaeon]